MQPTIFDVVIVGSGAGGGTLASHLARQGVDVALVEGGPRVNTRTDFNTHALPFEFPTRQIPTMRPGKEGFDTERSRGVGGKTCCGMPSRWRFSQRDFKGRTYRRRRRGLAGRLQGHRALLRRSSSAKSVSAATATAWKTSPTASLPAARSDQMQRRDS